MRLDRSQRQCVAESERLRYSAPAATVEANTVRVGELEPDELSSEDESWDDKDFGLCIVEHRTDSTKEAIVTPPESMRSRRVPPIFMSQFAGY